MSEARSLAGEGLTNVALGNNTLSESRTYDPNRGWLTSIQVGSVYLLNNLTYAGNGNVLTANDSVNGNWNYSPSGSPYDGVNRLKAANITTGQTFNYNFDAWGNMSCTYTQGPGSCLALNYDPNTNRISDSIHQYDNNVAGGPGNLTADGTHGYVYDGENRVICVGVDLSGNCTPTSVYYFYDAAGQRVGKQQYNTLEDYVYDPQGQIASMHDGTAALVRTEFYGAGRHTATLNGSTLTSAHLAWNHADWLGTERVHTDSNGNIIEACTDTPYGMNLTCTTNPPGQADPFPMHFTGKQRDYESGNDYFGARYYSSNQGRFGSADPTFLLPNRLVNPQRWNMFGYAVNNPLRYVDPNGRDAMFVVFPRFRAEAGGRRYPTGHAAMIVVDKNGRTTYREYGRYPPSGDAGRIRPVHVHDLQMDKEGHPTDASMQDLLEQLSQRNQDGPVEALYFDEDDPTDAALLKELQRRLEENADPSRERYSLRNHNCGTLFCETMSAAGHPMSHGPWYSTPNYLFNLYTWFYEWWSAYSYADGKMKKAKTWEEVVTTRFLY